MPGKHVHFSAASYAGSSTPSPSFSTSTLPSSPGLITPPPLGFGSPYRTTPLPGIAACLHPLLSPEPNPVIAYDLLFAPETMRPLVPISSGILDEPATNPKVLSMDISCPHLPWRITVMPRSKKFGYVTIGDVFVALYRALRLNVTKEEFDLIPSAGMKDAITQAFRARYKGQPTTEMYDLEKAKGLKRIDFLCTHTRFTGLVPAKEGADGWILIVS
ncbi:hypothetical protein BDN70DRAFT_863674 [Pholiota conissans]|uniref:DUF6699 domain-containing protein n=1 Tax=Pholiota conissans TaxID=109636 RepID=A0A9P6CXD3_9AGAR|nr:hypothetical protein BDN70DRAFT_863674 [Pholiota conissans]